MVPRTQARPAAIRSPDASVVRLPRWNTNPATTAPATKIKEDHRNVVV